MTYDFTMILFYKMNTMFFTEEEGVKKRRSDGRALGIRTHMWRTHLGTFGGTSATSYNGTDEYS